MPQLQRSIDPAHNARLTHQWLRLSERIRIQHDRNYTTYEDNTSDAHSFDTLIFTDGSVEQDVKDTHGKHHFCYRCL